jgi:single-stranded-DNA-specific exonuclease
VYRYVRNRAKTAGDGFAIDDLYELSAQISEKYSIEMNFFKLKRALEIFEELGLLGITNAGQKSITIKAAEDAAKVELESSRLYTVLQGVKSCF